MSDVERIAPEPADAEWEALRSAIRGAADRLRADAALLEDLGLYPRLANVIEFGPVALSRASAAHRRESSERKRLEATARANFTAQARTHAAVIDLLDAAGPADLASRLDAIARERFDLAAAVVAIEGPQAVPDGWRPLAPGQADLILGPRRASLMGRLPTALGLFGDQAPVIGSLALARLELGPAPRLGVLALGAGDPEVFSADLGTELVDFLARVVERTATRWLTP